MSGPAVVAIGGGHGLAISLRAARSYARTLTAVVATGDDGGSSGRLRAEIDMPAPGDLRRCLTAMAGDPVLAEGLEHRFSSGELKGHAVGNLVLAGLYDAGHDLQVAADHVGRWLQIDPSVRVLPATREPVHLVAHTGDGEVRGQVAVEGTPGIRRLTTDPPDPIVPDDVLTSIGAADQVLLGPGSFFTSVLSAASVPRIRDAIAGTDAQVVLVANLRADEAEVQGFDVARHLEVLRDHGIEPDLVVAQEGAMALGDVDRGGEHTPEIVLADIDRPHGLAHDADLLGPVLSRLA